MSKFLKKLKYTDILSLEVYQCILLLFVNPAQLIEASHMNDNSCYIRYCAFASIVLGLFSIVSIFKEDIKIKKSTFRLHWILCFVVVSLLIKGMSKTPLTIISFYSSQLLCSMYCYWRISVEYFARRIK